MNLRIELERESVEWRGVREAVLTNTYDESNADYRGSIGVTRAVGCRRNVGVQMYYNTRNTVREVYWSEPTHQAHKRVNTRVTI